MKFFKLTLIIGLSVATLSPSLHASVKTFERMKLLNTFTKPEEVIKYYCARDAQGFVWAGLLDGELKAFTLWPTAPAYDSFYVATKYEIGPPQYASAEQASVEVKYDVKAISDGHGTVVPIDNRKRNIVFELKKDRGSWKIAEPGPSSLPPVLLESFLPASSD